ncbi:hypothetical protein [uncultured Cellulomonas sp.]|uniref:hypothetical protein n=1 Tax=uncultured Cellulomonas sp. TaxID=189682 RepID=UPI0026027BDE|nr:hypothetical protein [uncultured Cellulomonas sp.]
MSADRTVPGLEPLRAALLARAQADAQDVRADASRQAADRLAAAQRQAEEILVAARARGADDAQVLVRSRRADARRAARGVVLGARALAQEELRRRAADAVRAQLADPVTRGRLVAQLQARLGPGTVVHDAPDGGLLAASPGRRAIDASVGALVAAALAELDLEGLWDAS